MDNGDLREPLKDLQLTRDHLLVDYGPVDFASQSKQLWLPWSADLFTAFERGGSIRQIQELTKIECATIGRIS